MDKFYSPASEALHKIAAALGVHVECFFSNPPQSGSDTSADECLRLWSALRTEEGRRQALEDLRLIAKLERR